MPFSALHNLILLALLRGVVNRLQWRGIRAFFGAG
jgi:hypothetical protein